MKFFGAKTSLGVDLGSRSIKLLKLRREGKSLVLDACLMQDLMDDHVDSQDASQVASVLSALVATRELVGQKVYSSIPDRDLIRLELILPPMPKKDLELAIRNELEGKLNFPLADACFDYLIDETSEPKKLKVRVFVSKRREVVSRFDLLKQAKLLPQAIESHMFAIAAALDFNGYLSSSSSNVVVDLGEQSTTVALFLGKELVSVNILSFGGAALNRHLAEKLSFTYQEADRELALCGNIETGVVDKTGQEVKAQVVEVLDEYSRALMTELESSIHYFRELAIHKPLQNLYIIGGGALANLLKKHCNEIFGLNTEIVDPLRSIEINSPDIQAEIERNQSSAFMTVAVGLALRGLPGVNGERAQI